MFSPLAAAPSSGEAEHASDHCINNRQAAKLLPLFSPLAHFLTQYKDQEHALYHCYNVIIKGSAQTGTDSALPQVGTSHRCTEGALHEEDRSHHQAVQAR